MAQSEQEHGADAILVAVGVGDPCLVENKMWREECVHRGKTNR